MEKIKVLVVEDSPSIRKGLSILVEQLGYEVEQATDGIMGLKAVERQTFNLIVTDIEMPKMNGYDFCTRLKENPETKGIPVIILSSLDNDADIDKGFQLGAAAYVSKTENNKVIQETIERVLKKSTFQKKKLILVVDDSPTICKLVVNGLSEAGFQVMMAENGKKAMELALARQPDLILSDIDMPVMNGVDFLKNVKSESILAGVPFVIMSAYNDRAIMRRMLQKGLSAFFVKPFNIDQLVITIEKLLSDQYILLLKDRERLQTERSMMLASISGLVEALEARDSYTRGHSDAVSKILVSMGKQMNLGEEDIESLAIGGRLHDLGKIGVRDNVLLKEGRLTTEEYKLIQQHPKIGAEILAKIPTLNNIIPVILHHHEKYDGTGYPEGLKGKQIHLWARMCAVADFFHALTSDRPYRKGIQSEETMALMSKSKGKDLCPESIEIFQHWLEKEKPTIT